MGMSLKHFETRGGKEVHVNPHYVRMIQALSSGGTRIYFDKEHHVEVDLPPREVAERLGGADAPE